MRFRITRLRILGTVVLFGIVFCLCSVYINFKPDTKNEVIQIVEFNPCYHLKEVKSEEYTVNIEFNAPIPENIRSKINGYFGYQTQSFDLPLLMRPGTPKILDSSKISLSLDFFLPFIQNYTGYLICIDPKKYKSSTFRIPHDILPEVDNFIPLNMSINYFRDEYIKKSKKANKEKGWSQMICYGTSYETRYCDMRNVAIYKKIFVFATKADYIFPEPFLSLGSRSPPFDRPEGRFIYEPAVIHESLKKIPGKIIYYDAKPLCYVMSRFYNSIMLWHTTFDFLVPAFHMFEKFEKNSNEYEKSNSNISKKYPNKTANHKSDASEDKNDKNINNPKIKDVNKKSDKYKDEIDKKNPALKKKNKKSKEGDRYVFIRDFEVDAFPELVNTLSKNKIISLYHDNETRKFDRIIVGIEKLEMNPSSARSNEESLGIKYNFTGNTALRLRSEVLSSLSINDTQIDPFSPLILIIERKSTNNRLFLNVDEIEEYLLSRCDFCRVKRIDYTNKDFISQVRLTTRASVLIGVHGSGLSNCLWMKPSTEREPTALIELMPNGYSCRNWFHGAAKIAKIDYYTVMGKKEREKIITITDEKSNQTNLEKDTLNYCRSRPELCSTLLCHDRLRDQNVTVEIGALSSVWLTIVSKFNQAQKLYDK